MNTTTKTKNKKSVINIEVNSRKKNVIEEYKQYKIAQGILLNKVYLQDCIEGMRLLPSGSIKLITADPPYNMKLKGQYWDKMTPDQFLKFNRAWLLEAYRVLEEDGAIICFGLHYNIFIVAQIMREIGFVIKIQYVWEKDYGRNSIYIPNHRAEFMILATKSKKSKLTYNVDYAKSINNGKNISNIIRTKRTPAIEKRHGAFPCQKPIELMERLIKLHSNEGDIILSPFSGSGTDCVASILANRNFIAYETDRDNLLLTNRRLQDVRCDNDYAQKFLTINQNQVCSTI